MLYHATWALYSTVEPRYKEVGYNKTHGHFAGFLPWYNEKPDITR